MENGEKLDGFYMDYDHAIIEDVVVEPKPIKKKKVREKKPYSPGKQYVKAIDKLKSFDGEVK